MAGRKSSRSDRIGKGASLLYLPTSVIRPNSENPRIIFRGDELQELADSIQDHGVQVPISVFKSRRGYTLIDGERRWRACQLINRDEMPAIIYPEPEPIQNIVYMFNIHRFRKDWDPLPTAMKLEELREMLEEEEGRPVTERELAALTGMSRGAVRRCNLIMEIPKRHRDEILRELNKPEPERRITTDLFIECQRAVRTIDTYLPDLSWMKTALRNSLISKYKRSVVVNVVHMRMVAKIARATQKGVPKRTVERALADLIDDPSLDIETAYARVAWAYDIRVITTQVKSLRNLIDSLGTKSDKLDAATRSDLKALATKIRALLGS